MELTWLLAGSEGKVVEYTEMSRSELHKVYKEASDELAKRQTTEVFFNDLVDLQDDYVEAFGGIHEKGEVWAECGYALPAYRRGDEVVHGKNSFISNIPCNTFNPSDRGWRLKGDFAPWKGPKYDHDAYMKGETVERGGNHYRAIEDYVMEVPSTKSEFWEYVEPEEEDDPEVGDE